jgi:quinol monooxygenase YgiN
LIGFVVAIMALAMPARAQDTAIYNIKYIEILPAAWDHAANILRRYAEAGRKHEGNLRFEVLQRRDRPNQFAIIEAWKDNKALEAHGTSEAVNQMRAKIDPILAAARDERPSVVLSVGEIKAGAGAKGKAIFVVTHVDVNGAKKDDGAAMLKALAEASRTEAGNLRYEAVTQANRANHFTLVEIWKDQGALEAHEAAKHTVKFRHEIFPLSGALFDQRLYQPM